MGYEAVSLLYQSATCYVYMGAFMYISRSVWHCITVASVTGTITARLDYGTYNLMDVRDVVVSHT